MQSFIVFFGRCQNDCQSMSMVYFQTTPSFKYGIVIPYLVSYSVLTLLVNWHLTLSHYTRYCFLLRSIFPSTLSVLPSLRPRPDLQWRLPLKSTQLLSQYLTFNWNYDLWGLNSQSTMKVTRWMMFVQTKQKWKMEIFSQSPRLLNRSKSLRRG